MLALKDKLLLSYRNFLRQLIDFELMSANAYL